MPDGVTDGWARPDGVAVGWAPDMWRDQVSVVRFVIGVPIGGERDGA